MMPSGHETTNLPPWALTKSWSSPTRRANRPAASNWPIRLSASVVLPKPDGPQISTPRSPSSSAVAWILVFGNLGSALGRQRHDEAGTAYFARFRARDVLGGQRAVVRFDDLAADRQPES